MRQRLNRAGILAFVLLVSIVGLSQTKRVNAELCPGALAHAGAFTPQMHCIKEYFSAGPLYNPTFSYSATSLSFRMPSMMWSALGHVIFTPAIQQKAAPNATRYWFLRFSRSSPTVRLPAFFF